MTVDCQDSLMNRVQQLEVADQRLSREVLSLNNRLDTALLTLTHNVSSLTDAIKTLQTSQEKALEMQNALILIQERSSVVPELQRTVHEMKLEQARGGVVIRQFMSVAGLIVSALIAAAVGFFVGK